MTKRPFSTRGIALISVLWVLILLSVLAAGLLRSSRTQVNLARNAADSARAEALAEAGLSLAVLKLLQPRADDRWQVGDAVYAWHFGSGKLRISLQDEAGKIDLNATQPALIRAFFEAAGVEPARAEVLGEALADYRDSDHDARTLGAEDADYEAAGYAHEAKDAPFAIIEELRLVYGMSAELYDRLATDVTVYSRQARPRSELASPLVRAALDGIVYRPSQSDSAAGLSGQSNSLEQVLDGVSSPVRLGVAKPDRQWHSGVLGIHVEARLDSGAVFVREAVIQVAPGQFPPYNLLAWRRGTRRHFPLEPNEDAE